MTNQKMQESLDAVRNFLTRNDGRPFILAGAAWLGEGHVDGMRLSGGIETAKEAEGVLTGMMLIVISPGASTAEERQKVLMHCCMKAYSALDEEREADDE